MIIDICPSILIDLKNEFCPEGKCSIAWPEKASYYEEELCFKREIFSRNWDDLTADIITKNYDNIFFLKGELFRYCLAVYIKAFIEMEIMPDEQRNAMIRGESVYSTAVHCLDYPDKNKIGKFESEIAAQHGYSEIYSEEKYIKDMELFECNYKNITEGQTKIFTRFLDYLCQTNFDELGDEASFVLKRYWGRFL